MPSAMELSPMPKPKLTGKQKSAAAALALILSGIYAVEGGYVNTDGDSGGPTNYGITERVARQNGYLGDMRWFPKTCTNGVTVCADAIYTRRYIDEPGFTPMLTVEPAVAQELVDTGVNMGPGIASRFFQASLNVLCGSRLTVDGRTGPGTVGAYIGCLGKRSNLCVVMLNALDGAQERRYRDIAAHNPSQRKFLKGWLRARIGNVPRSRCPS